MMINRSKSTFLFLALVFGVVQLSFVGRCWAQKEPQVTVGVIEPPTPVLEGKAHGDVKPFKRTHTSLKASILAHPIPEAALVFVVTEKHNAKINVRLPAGAKKPLLECWRAELTFYYLRAFEVHDLQTRINERNVFGGVVAKVQAQLQTLTIDTPTGRRKISHNEAVSLTHLLNNSAQKIVNEAKDSVGAKPIA